MTLATPLRVILVVGFGLVCLADCAAVTTSEVCEVRGSRSDVDVNRFFARTCEIDASCPDGPVAGSLSPKGRSRGSRRCPEVGEHVRRYPLYGGTIRWDGPFEGYKFSMFALAALVAGLGLAHRLDPPAQVRRG